MSQAVDALPLDDDDARARGWLRALAALSLALAALMVPMWEPALRLYDLWLNNASYGHGILIVPIMVYLFWLQRRDFVRMTPAPSLVGVGATAGLMMIWFGARMLGIVMIEQLVLVASLVAVSWAVLGFRIALRAAPIIIYLMCAVPVWSYLTPILQDQTAAGATAMVRALDVPVYLEGLYISIPDGRFVVADVCSGLRYLLAALSLGGFYALLNLHRWWSRIALIGVSFALGIVFNWIRVVGIVYVGHHSQMQSPLVAEHNTYGWVLFLLVVLGILVLGRLLERVDSRREPAAPRVPADGRPAGGVVAFLVAAALVSLVSIAPAAIATAWLALPAEPTMLDLARHARAGGWRAAPDAATPWQPQFSGMDAAALAVFEKSGVGAPVDVFIAYYVTQRQDAEAINDTNENFDRAVWWRYAVRPVPDRVTLAPGVVAEEYLIQRVDGSERRMVWRTNWVNDRFVVDPLRAKLQQLAALLSGRRAAASLVLATRIDDDEPRARTRLRDFTATNLGPILDHLRALSVERGGGS